MVIPAQNLRYLLWKSGKTQRDWSQTLAEWAGCYPWRANELLQGEPLTEEERKQIAQRLDLTEEEVAYASPEQAGVLLLKENLHFLLRDEREGEVAEAMGVNATTLSRWKHGRQSPPAARLSALAEYFGLPQDTDLCHDPIFLSLEPVTDMQRRQWVQQQVEALHPETLRRLFPALERLLEHP